MFSGRPAVHVRARCPRAGQEDGIRGQEVESSEVRQTESTEYLGSPESSKARGAADRSSGCATSSDSASLDHAKAEVSRNVNEGFESGFHERRFEAERITVWRKCH